VLAQDRLRQNLPLPGVVGTLMTNMAVELALRAQGVEVVRAKVGDRYVLEALEARGWLLGGEGSGHLLALDKHSTGDGMVSALQVLQACVHQGKSLAQILEGVSLFPQTLLNVRTPNGFDWTAHAPLHTEIARVEAELGDQGRVLVRPSGTEPLLRIMVESSDAQRSLALAQGMVKTLPLS
jgi:phosphoglucosamine mutase